tara:strand:- start:1630 stop:2484 length:855 start_codon:yes stop_codon:yes gene_type:complete
MAQEIGITEAGSTRQALVSSIVQEVIAEKAQLLPLITDYSAQAQPGSQSLGIPRRDTFSAATKAENTAVDNSEMTFSVDTITFAHKYVSAKIEDIARVQSSVDIPAEVVKEIGEAMAREADALILAQLKLASTSSPDHKLPYADATNDDIALTDITNARKLLRSNGKVMFNDEKTYLLVSPEQEEFLLSLDNLIDAGKYGSEVSIQSGELGKVFGMRVVVSDLLAASESIAFHSSAVGFASQQNFKLEFDRDLSNLADHYVGSGLMGAKVMHAGKRNVFFADGH